MVIGGLRGGVRFKQTHSIICASPTTPVCDRLAQAARVCGVLVKNKNYANKVWMVAERW